MPTLTFCILDHFSCSFRNAIRVSNSLNPDQVRRFDSSDMGSNRLPRLHVSADRKIRS